MPKEGFGPHGNGKQYEIYKDKIQVTFFTQSTFYINMHNKFKMDNFK